MSIKDEIAKINSDAERIRGIRLAITSGRLCTNGWAGRSEVRVEIIGETPKKYRIRNPGPTHIRLGGRGRLLGIGETALVPKTAVKRDL